MKALTRSRYGGPELLAVSEERTPVPTDAQVLVQVHFASLNPLDWHVLRGEPYLVRLMNGVRRPKSPLIGVDLAGTVVSVGPLVTEFSTGDEVFGSANGTLAQFVVTKSANLVKIPTGTSLEACATLPCAGVTALQALRDVAKLSAGQKVLINGASGGVGTFAVQIAKSLGAEVTAVCSGANIELVRSLGADNVIDYTSEDFTKSSVRFDVVLDAVGNRKLLALRRVTTPKGTVLLCAGAKGRWIKPMLLAMKGALTSPIVSQQLRPVMAKITNERQSTLGDMLLSGAIVATIDRSFALADAPSALAYLEEGHVRGKVIIAI